MSGFRANCIILIFALPLFGGLPSWGLAAGPGMAMPAGQVAESEVTTDAPIRLVPLNRTGKRQPYEARPEEQRPPAPPVVRAGTAATPGTGLVPRDPVTGQPLPSISPAAGPTAAPSAAPSDAPSDAPVPTPLEEAVPAPVREKDGRGRLGASTIVVDSLPDLNPDSVGTLDEAGGGLGAGLWQGVDRPTLDRMLPRLPAALRSLVLRDLMRRLLLSNATAPGGNTSGGNLLAMRLERLLAMGDFEGMRDLREAGPKRITDQLAQSTLVDSLLLAGDTDGACKFVSRRMVERESNHFAKILIFCQAHAGEHDRAALGLGLMREEQAEEDPAFVTLIDAMGGDEEARVESLPRPSPLILAMMSAAKQELPMDVGGATAPPLLRAIAASDNAPQTVRLEMAERAAALGVVPVETVLEIYAGMTFSPEDFERSANIGPADYGPEARALLYQALRRQMDPVERGRLLQRSWHLAGRFGLYRLAARVTAPVLQGMPPAPELAWFAPDAARALFAAGRHDRAMAWIESMRGRAGAGSVIVAALWPLAQLAGDVVVWDRRALDSWAFTQRRMHGPDAEGRIALLYALFSGLGVNAGNEQQWDLLLPPPVIAAVDTVPDAWRAASDAAIAGRRGEMLARILTGVGTRELVDVPPSGWRAIVASLRAVGLEAEAKALALEAAVAAGL
ncbi:MAG: hypothetical protein ACTSXZ_00110 [Alphaproteobacteria bacterium]